MLGAIASLVTIGLVVVSGGRYVAKTFGKRHHQRTAEVFCGHEISLSPSHRRDWLVVGNLGPAVAQQVTIRLPDTPANRTVKVLGDLSPIAELRPGEQKRYGLVLLAESKDKIEVVLTWNDRAGSHSLSRQLDVA